MKRSSLALITVFLLATVAHGQSVARGKGPTSVSSSKDQMLAARALSLLDRLGSDVIVYRSLSDFEATGKLTAVPFETFQSDLRAVTAEVEPIISLLPASRLSTELGNALASYRDGAFWLQQIHQPRVVHVSMLTMEKTRTAGDRSFLTTVPYTVAIHWRQAAKYLKQAHERMSDISK